MCICVAGLHLALHPTQALGHPVPAAAPPPSAPTLATRPSAAPSAAAARGIQGPVCLCISHYTELLNLLKL